MTEDTPLDPMENACQQYIHAMMMGGYYGEQQKTKWHKEIADMLGVNYKELKKYFFFLEDFLDIDIDKLRSPEMDEMSFLMFDYGGKLYDFLSKTYGCNPKKPVKQDDIIQYIANEITCSPADVAKKFDMTIDAARMRLKRMSEGNKPLLDRENVGYRSFYTIKNMNVHYAVSARAIVKNIIAYLVTTNHPKLSHVSESEGGNNSGGGYTYHWRTAFELIQEIPREELIKDE